MFASRFYPEPPFHHQQADKIGVLICNLGTPQEATPAALRTYLDEFLSDPRVVEIPKLLWWMILHGIILRTRPAKSAKKYASIWSDEGSPLLKWTRRQAHAVQQQIDPQSQRVLVSAAMRYGQPSVAAQLQQLKTQGASKILIVPAYPQYAAATTASVIDAVSHWSLKTRHLPEFRFINHYHDDEGYIHALAQSVQRYWQTHGRAQKLVMSFHGLPQRSLHQGDPYFCECHKTARLLAQSLQLNEDEYVVTFQSRFGRERWLEPYTEPTLVALAQSGVTSVQVICPGFSSDCLETLEEIDQECRAAFMAHAGQSFGYIPCLNDDPAWIEALAHLIERHTQGWRVRSSEESKMAHERAIRAGAKS